MAFDLTCFATVKAKRRSANSSSVGFRLVTTLRSDSRDHGVVAALHQEAAGERAEGEAGALGIGQAAGEQQPQILLLGENRLRVVARVRRDDHLGEDLGDLARGLGVERAVERDDAAEGADRIAGESLGVGLGEASRRARRRRDWRA